MREKFARIVDSRFGKLCDKLCNSVWYIVAYGVVCVIAHSFDIPVTGAALLTALLVPALLFCKNSFVLTPFLLMCAFVLSEETKPETGYYNSPGKITVLCILAVVLAAALVFNIVYYGKWRTIFNRAYFTVSLCILTAALLMGGVGTPTWTFAGFGLAIAIAVTMFLPYALMVNCGEYIGRKTVEYFAWAIIVAALSVCACFLKQYIKFDINLVGGMSAAKEHLALGFVGPNTGAAIITLAIPMTFYFIYIYKHGFAFFALIAVELMFIVMSFSRASLVVAIPGTAIVSIWMCFKKKNGRLAYWITFGLCVVAVVAIAIVFRKTIYNELVGMFAGNVTGSGRTTLWKQGFAAWKNSPIFGVCLTYLQTYGNWYYSFHCTPLTYLYCTGIVGLAAYVYHRYKSVRLVFSAKLTPERVFVALTVLAMVCNALLDIAMTSATHLLYYAIMLALLDHDVRKTKSDAENTSIPESALGETMIVTEQTQKEQLTEGEKI